MNVQRRNRIAGVVLVSAIATIGLVASGSFASAVWTKPLTVTGSVAAGTIATSATVTALDGTITNDDYQTTHVIRVNNNQPATSSYTGTSALSVTVNAVTASGLGARMSVAVWPVASAAACTDSSEPAAGYQSAAWTTGLTTSSVAALPNASAYFCTRGYPTGSTPSPTASAAQQNRKVVAAGLGVSYTVSASGSQSFTPTYTAKISRGNFTAQAAASGATTLNTSLIFSARAYSSGSYGNFGRPLSPTGTCWNVAGGGDTSPPGHNLIAYGSCQPLLTPRNERFHQAYVAGGNSAIQIRADSTIAANGYLQVNTDGTLVQTQTSNANELRQVWIMQFANVGADAAGVQREHVQFVNAATGECIRAPASAGGSFDTALCGSGERFRTYWFAVTSVPLVSSVLSVVP